MNRGDIERTSNSALLPTRYSQTFINSGVISFEQYKTFAGVIVRFLSRIPTF